MNNASNIRVLKGGSSEIDNKRNDAVKLGRRERSESVKDRLAKTQQQAGSGFGALGKVIDMLLETVAAQEERILCLETALGDRGDRLGVECSS